jgi:hypothetical protein
MWIRKSPSEIAEVERRKQRQRFSPLGALGLAAILMLFIWLVPRSPRSTGFLTSPAFPLAFLTIFVLFYMSHVMIGRYVLPGVRFGPPTAIVRNMICPVCRTTQLDTESHSCACGGKLESLDYWHWVEDKKADAAIRRGT